MPYMSVIDHAQVRTDTGIKSVVHSSKTVKLSKLEDNIANASNNPVRLVRWSCCATPVVNLNNYICSIRLGKTFFCCLQARQSTPPAHFLNSPPRQLSQNESAIDKAPLITSQFKPQSLVQAGGYVPSPPPCTPSLSPALGQNPVVVNISNQFNAWKVLLEEIEEFSYCEQNNIYNHIIEHLTELTLTETKKLVYLLEQLISQKDYECPTCHWMDELYMAAYKTIENKS